MYCAAKQVSRTHAEPAIVIGSHSFPFILDLNEGLWSTLTDTLPGYTAVRKAQEPDLSGCFMLERCIVVHIQR